MNHFALVLVAIVLVIILWGWITERLALSRGPVEAQRPHVYLALVYSALFKIFVVCTNYSLASTALARLLSKEKMNHDVFLKAAFGGPAIHINHMFAIVVIAASFVTVERLVHSLARLLGVDEDAHNAPARSSLDIVRQALEVLCWAAGAAVSLYFDTCLLMLRTATLTWSSKYSGELATLPDLPTLLSAAPHTMAAWMIYWLGVFYPLVILLSVVTFRRAWINFRTFVAAMREERRQAMNALLGPVVPAAVPPVGGPAAPLAPAAPLPNSWIQPVPANPGPIPVDGTAGVQP